MSYKCLTSGLQRLSVKSRNPYYKIINMIRRMSFLKNAKMFKLQVSSGSQTWAMWTTFKKHPCISLKLLNTVYHILRGIPFLIKALYQNKKDLAHKCRLWCICVICLGLKELSPPNLNLLHIMQNETHASEPILFILSLGADPSQELQDLAKSTIGAEKYHQVCDFLFVIFCDAYYVCVKLVLLSLLLFLFVYDIVCDFVCITLSLLYHSGQ